MRGHNRERGSVMVMMMLFVSVVGLLLFAALRPLLMERASVERDTLRLAAAELLAAGVEAARAAGAGTDLRVADPALLDTPRIRGGFAVTAAPAAPVDAVDAVDAATLLTVEATVESPALRCKQTRRVLLAHAGAIAPLTAKAASDGPFTCAPVAP